MVASARIFEPLRALLETDSRRSRFMLWLTALALLWWGSLAWLDFFEYGRFSFAFHDWPKERDGFSVLSQAVRDGAVPWYSTVVRQGTARFLGNPETPWTPDVLLLRWQDANTFVIVHVVTAFVVGLAGCLALARRWQLSPLSLMALVLLTCFNGHIAAHLAAGHSMWVGTFLLPWFALAERALAHSPLERGPQAGMIVVLTALLLLGAFHIAAMAMLYLIASALLYRDQRRPVISILLLTGLVGAARIAPALAAVEVTTRPDGFGYPDVWTMLQGLVANNPLDTHVPGHPIDAWWEMDAYIGLEGLAFLVVFGIVLARKAGDDRWRRVLLPAGILALLSLGDTYTLFHALHVPVLGVERIATRFLIIPLVLLSFEACLQFQRSISRRQIGWGLWWLSLAGVILLCSALRDHFQMLGMGATGQVPALAPAMATAAVIDRWHVIEPGYHRLVLAGVITSGAGVIVCVLWWRGLSQRTALRPDPLAS